MGKREYRTDGAGIGQPLAGDPSRPAPPAGASPPGKWEAPTAERIDAVRRGLLGWYAQNARDLPWRHTRDPYRVLVSEVMLQQTQVDRVVPYYHAWLDRFPTVTALAEAPTADVITQWAGLGYNRRAVNLQRTARAVLDLHGGEFPRTIEELRALPGIGPYTAGAVACFAFEQDVPFLDTNMRRVLHRLVAGVDVPRPAASDRDLLDVAAAVLPPGNGWSWNQALIEFGALHCTARRPACVACPLQRSCRAFPAIQTAIKLLPRGTRRKDEEPFSGSNRFYRGRIVAALRELPPETRRVGIGLRELGALVRDGFGDDDLPWLYDLVRGLERDGLTHAAEDAPAYDVAAPEPGSVRVRLP